MTTNDVFSDRLAGWLKDDAEQRVPDHLDEVLIRTAVTPQRAWWSSPERWLPVDVTSRANSFAPPWFGRLLLVALLILAIAALAIFAVGSRDRRLPPPFGPAKNGAITFASSGDIYSLDSIDGTPRAVISGATNDGAPAFWRDGTHLGFVRDTHASGSGVALMVANADGSNVRQLVDLKDGPSWVDTTPDGSVLAFAGVVDGIDGIYLMSTDGSAVPHRLDLGDHRVGWPMWRPPDAHELLYLDWDSSRLRLYRVAPDGTGRHLVKDLGQMDSATLDQLDLSVSPDGSSIAYATSRDGVFLNHILDLDAGVDRPLKLGPYGGHELHGQIAPDGKKLLFHYADDTLATIQEMLAPIDGSAPAIRVGPPYPIVDGSAELSQAFSPDGRSIIIDEARDKVVRIVDAASGGLGRGPGWQTGDLPGWQRLAP